jgi:hypothetical protein
MLAYCGRLLRALRALTAGPGCCLAAPPVRRMRRTPESASFCDRLPYIGPRYARQTIAETCSIWPAVTRAPRAHRRSGAALAGSPCDARVAPLATAIISQTGSWPPSATIDRHLARLSAASGNAALAKCSGMDGYRSEPMRLKAKVADRGELIINCLAVLALLAVGVVWGPI